MSEPMGPWLGTHVLKGLPCGLEDKAREAVLDTEFVPGKLNGEPVDSVTTVSVHFTLSTGPRTGTGLSMMEVIVH